MGAMKKKAIKFIAKGNLSKKLQQRNNKKRIQALKNKKKNRSESSDARGAKGSKTSNDTAKAKQEDKHESDMMDDMDVDEFLNANFLDEESDSEPEYDDANRDDDSDSEEDDDEEQGTMKQPKAKSSSADDVMEDDSSSEEEDEDALDPRYMVDLPADEPSDDEDAPAGGDDQDDDDEEEEESSKESSKQQKSKKQKQDAGGLHTLTMEDVLAVEKASFEQHSLKAFRKLLKMFNDACHAAEAADSDKAGDLVYDIQSSSVYNRLMLNVLRKSHIEFARLVCEQPAENADDNADEDLDDEEQEEPTINKKKDKQPMKIDEHKWKKHGVLVRRFLNNCSYLLEQNTSQAILLFVVRELTNYLPLLVSEVRTARKLLKSLLKVWAVTHDRVVCMVTFVRIRELALLMPFPFLETCLKGIYLAYSRNTKFTSEITLPHNVLLGNCVVELFGLDLKSSYQHAFVYIRELAVTIRKTITAPSVATFKSVLNWQFMNQLRLWTAVLSAYPEDNQLKPLVYPLSQLLFAVVRLSSTLRYAPMRLQCVKLLQQLAFHTNLFVPTSGVLLEILNLAPFSTSYKGFNKSSGGNSNNSGGNSKKDDTVDLDLAVKLSKANLDSKRVHDAILSRVFELLEKEMQVYRFHIGFPEYTVPIWLNVNKFASNCKIPKWKVIAKALVGKLVSQADSIRQQRSQVEFAPCDVDKLTEFLKQQREKAQQQWLAAEKQQLEAQMAKAEEVQKLRQQKAQDDEDNKKKKSKTKQQVKPAVSKKQSRKRQVDEETFQKVKKMSLKEFRQAVDQVDEEDKVEDFNFSSDDEE